MFEQMNVPAIEMYELEMKVIHAIKDIEDYGCKVDIKYLKKLQVTLEQEIAAIEYEVRLIDPQLNIGSSTQLISWFQAKGIVVPKQVQKKEKDNNEDEEDDTDSGMPVLFNVSVPTEKKIRYTVDSDALEGIDHPIAKLASKYRKALKFKSTYVDAILESHIEEVIHPDFRTIQARTGRLSCTRPSLQTIPKDPKDLSEEERNELVSIRKAFVPRENCRLFPMDYSQQEYRLFVHYTQDPSLIAMYKEQDVDFHEIVAKLTGQPRDKAKQYNFSLLYGAGPDKLSKSLGCSVAEAKKVMALYFEKIKGSEFLIEDTKNRAQSRGFVKTLFGRVRFLNYVNRAGQRINESHKALNTIIQGSAADIMKIMLVKVNNLLKIRQGGSEPFPYGARIIMTIHDELILEVPIGQEGLIPLVKKTLEYLPMVKVPMVADVSVCESNWAAKRKVTNEELLEWENKPVKILKNTEKNPYKLLPINPIDFQPKTGLWST